MDNEMERRLERINRQLAGEEFAAVHRNLYNNRDGVILKGECDKKSHNKLLVVSYPIHLG